jgi:hypothetical protein
MTRPAGALDYPNVCGVHEAGEAPDGRLSLAMPLGAGDTLRAHRGIVHRDLEPANVIHPT